MPRPGKYLFKRKGSQNWWLRLQYTGRLREKFGAKKEISMGTSDYAEAELRAFEHIRDHKLNLFIFKNATSIKQATPAGPQYEPNRLHPTDDGGSVLATEDELKFFSKEGLLIKTEPNQAMWRVRMRASHQERRMLETFAPKREHPDSLIVENWIAHRGLNKHLANEAREVWRQLQLILKNRRLSACTREQAKQLVHALGEQGNKSSTIEKKIGHLRAAVNLAIDDGAMTSNPFNKVVPRADDKLHRLPLSEFDMKVVRENLHKLSGSDQLLWKLMATTEMRLDEPFTIVEEFEEDGVRYVMVGTKTETSRRRIPLPSALLPYLTERIHSPLFPGPSETAGKRLRYLLRQLGISYHKEQGTGDKRKVVHSLRHRA
jgi:hypothetical protein